MVKRRPQVGRWVRELHGIDLFEVSIVPHPANDQARILDTKSVAVPPASMTCPVLSAGAALRRSMGPATCLCRPDLPRMWGWANQTSGFITRNGADPLSLH